MVLAAAAAGFALWLAVNFSQQPLLEAHAFRQTQTALTSYWFVREGFKLVYETPVAGAPWSIPYEFPIYQGLAALVVKATGLPLDATGRLLSFAFLLACLWPAHRLVKLLELPARTFWIFTALLLSSPLYLFWGRSFMIETTALFFTLAFLPFAVSLQRRPDNLAAAAGAGLFLSLALLQKITTALPVAMVMALCWLFCQRMLLGRQVRDGRVWASLLLAYALPVIIALAWTQYADLIKQDNALGSMLTSKKLLPWNFGSPPQRFSMALWDRVVWERALCNNAGGALGLAILAAGLALAGRPLRPLLAVALLLFLLPLLVFTNLHILHEYYQASVTLFLIGALALVLGAGPSASNLSPRWHRRGQWISAALALLVAISNWHALIDLHREHFYPETPWPSHKTLAIAQHIRTQTPRDSGIAVFGYDWSSEIAYYAERKSITVPEFLPEKAQVWATPERYLGGLAASALVVCEAAGTPARGAAAQRAVADKSWALARIDDCDVLTRSDNL